MLPGAQLDMVAFFMSIQSHVRRSKNAQTAEDQLEELRRAVKALIEVVKKLEREP